MVRNVQNPQTASRNLVDHALARFSTDNLSVMVVRFDPKKLQNNTSLDIGVENQESKDKHAISETEMIISEARRNSGIDPTHVNSRDSEEIHNQVIQEHEEEDPEPGPELTPEGRHEAERLLRERQNESSRAHS